MQHALVVKSGKPCFVQIESNVKGGSVRNVESARVSIPSTLKFEESKKWLVLPTEQCLHLLTQ